MAKQTVQWLPLYKRKSNILFRTWASTLMNDRLSSPKPDSTKKIPTENPDQGNFFTRIKASISQHSRMIPSLQSFNHIQTSNSQTNIRFFEDPDPLIPNETPQKDYGKLSYSSQISISQKIIKCYYRLKDKQFKLNNAEFIWLAEEASKIGLPIVAEEMMRVDNSPILKILRFSKMKKWDLALEETLKHPDSNLIYRLLCEGLQSCPKETQYKVIELESYVIYSHFLLLLRDSGRLPLTKSFPFTCPFRYSSNILLISRIGQAVNNCSRLPVLKVFKLISEKLQEIIFVEEAKRGDFETDLLLIRELSNFYDLVASSGQQDFLGEVVAKFFEHREKLRTRFDLSGFSPQSVVDLVIDPTIHMEENLKELLKRRLYLSSSDIQLQTLKRLLKDGEDSSLLEFLKHFQFFKVSFLNFVN